MTSLIEGEKQILDDSIPKGKLSLVAPTAGKDPVTKTYFDNRKINGKSLATDITLILSDFTELSNYNNTPYNDTVGF